MLLLLHCLIVLALLLVFWQDHIYRAVSWPAFPALGILFFLHSSLVLELQTILMNFLICFLFILSQAGIITLYFSLKEKRWVNLFKGYLGPGDFLFLIASAFLFSPVNYLLFYMCSLTIVLAWEIIRRFLLRTEDRKIPLAGIQALMMAAMFFAMDLCRCFSLTDDQTLLRYVIHG